MGAIYSRLLRSGSGNICGHEIEVEGKMIIKQAGVYVWVPDHVSPKQKVELFIPSKKLPQAKNLNDRKIKK
jgi:hypothetical protein